MSRHDTVMLAGHTVESKRASYSEHARVVLHKMGSPENSFFTPAEARQLAAALLAAADRAEGK